MCRLAINRMPMSHGVDLSDMATETNAAQENLKYLMKLSKSKVGKDDAIDLANHERTFKLPRFLPGTESAEFFVLLSSDGKSRVFKVEDVKFISGSEKMKNQGKQLRTLNFNMPAPAESATHFIRRGILGCYQYTGCSFVWLDPGSVNSVN